MWDLSIVLSKGKNCFFFSLVTHTVWKNNMLTKQIPIICRMSDNIAVSSVHSLIYFRFWFIVWTRNRCLLSSSPQWLFPSKPLFFTVMDHLHVFLGCVEFCSNQSAASVGQNKARKGKWSHPIQITCMSVANMAVSTVVCLPSLLSRAWSSNISCLPCGLKKKTKFLASMLPFWLSFFLASKPNIYSCFNPTIFFWVAWIFFWMFIFCTWILSHDGLWIVLYWIALNEKLIKNDFFYKGFLVCMFTFQCWYLVCDWIRQWPQ